MKRPLKYPAASIVGSKFGRRSQAYKMVYALEQWAVRHGYEGHREHVVPTKADRKRQQELKLKG
jgi:hypothetical protein